MEKIIAIFVLLIGALIGLAVWADRMESQECAEKGGHIISKTATGITTSGAMATSTYSFCISGDGRILE